MLCRSVDIGTGWRSCELFRAFEDGPSVGTFYGTPCIQMDVHLNGFFCVPSGLTWMKMLSRKLHNYAWTHWSVGAQHGTPAMTGARILLDNNCNGMVLIPSRAQVELMVADWRSDLPRKAEVDAVGTWKQEPLTTTPPSPSTFSNSQLYPGLRAYPAGPRTYPSPPPAWPGTPACCPPC